MSYKIKFDDITSVQVESQKTISAWGESVGSLNKAMTDFINNQNLQGQAISSMRTYLVEVHGTLLQTLVKRTAITRLIVIFIQSYLVRYLQTFIVL